MKSLSLSQPHLLVMVGTPGSGKTFFAEKFADTFHAPFINLKKLMKLGKTDEEAAASLFYSQLEELLKTQQTIITEGRADTRAERSELSRRARTAGYSCLFIWVQTDPATAKTRAIKEKDDMSASAYDQHIKRFNSLDAIEKSVVISGKHTYASQAKVVLKKLSSPRTEISTYDIAPKRPEQPGRRNIAIR